MPWLRMLVSRVAAMFRWRKLDGELDEELRAHLEMAADENRRRGMSDDDAWRRALRDFGGVTQVRETVRAREGWPLIENLRRDMGYAVRMLRWLIKQAASAVQKKVAESDDGAWAGYWAIHDPLLTLRDLMGHASVATTQVYLHAIDATRLYANIIEDVEGADEDEDVEGADGGGGE